MVNRHQATVVFSPKKITRLRSMKGAFGKDIISALGIAPGPEVGQALDQARILYDEEPCTGAQLIERLRERLSQ
jgi:hypothetical protein